jgi:hypothetical protein
VERLESFKRLLANLRDLRSLDFGFVLRDGSAVPISPASRAASRATVRGFSDARTKRVRGPSGLPPPREQLYR